MGSCVFDSYHTELVYTLIYYLIIQCMLILVTATLKYIYFCTCRCNTDLTWGKYVKIAQHQMSNASAVSWREQVTFWRDDDVCFVLDQHIFHSASSLKNQSTDMSPHSDTLSWFRANLSLLLLLSAACLAKQQQIPIL